MTTFRSTSATCPSRTSSTCTSRSGSTFYAFSQIYFPGLKSGRLFGEFSCPGWRKIKLSKSQIQVLFSQKTKTKDSNSSNPGIWIPGLQVPGNWMSSFFAWTLHMKKRNYFNPLRVPGIWNQTIKILPFESPACPGFKRQVYFLVLLTLENLKMFKPRPLGPLPWKNLGWYADNPR